MNLWNRVCGMLSRPRVATFTPPPDDSLPHDYVATAGTIVPSARAINELLDYWREKASHAP